MGQKTQDILLGDQSSGPVGYVMLLRLENHGVSSEPNTVVLLSKLNGQPHVLKTLPVVMHQFESRAEHHRKTDGHKLVDHMSWLFHELPLDCVGHFHFILGNRKYCMCHNLLHSDRQRCVDSWIQHCTLPLVSPNFVDDLHLTLMSTHFQFQEENWDSWVSEVPFSDSMEWKIGFNSCSTPLH